MRRLNIFQILRLIPVVFISFYGCHVGFQHFGDFSIKYLENGCKVLTDGMGRELLLVPRGHKASKEYKGAQKVEIPVRKVVVYSTTTAAMIKELGVVESLAAVTTKKENWYIPEIRKGIEEGEVVYLGEYNSIDYEKLKLLNPDVVFTWDKGIIPKLNELGIPCVITYSGIAQGLIARIKFMQFLSAFYNQEDKAKTFVERQLKRIDEVAAKTNEAKKDLKAVWADIYERKVLVEPGNAWTAQVVERAGGKYIFHDLEGGS
ncbi:MAG: ABC transporter substrate-binding protein [Deltaproteobacteria bacterium]|nr:ABC transporter substrate-binding protein [Deltaproteobacteria bacterium]